MLGCGAGPTDPTSPATEDPRIACPPSLSVVSPTGQAVPVTFDAPTVTGGRAPLTISCVPVAGSSFGVGTTAVICSVVDGQQRTASCNFSVNVLPPARISLTRFVAFGDSITVGEDGNSLASGLPGVMPFVLIGREYPTILQQRLASRYTTQAIVVDNRGQGGEAAGSPQALSRFTQLVSSRAYESVLIMEGSNDLSSLDDRAIAPAVANLRSMIREARLRSVRAYLATIPPMNPAGRRGRGWALVGPMNDQLRALASSEGVTLVDVHQAFGNDFSLLSSDGLHPNEDGFAKIAETFLVALRGTLELPAAAMGPVRTTAWPSRWP